MKPRVTLITLGVDDLERAVAFYRDGLGWKTEGIVGKEFEHGAVAFFDLQTGLKLALWPRKSLAHDSGLPLGAASATEFSLAYNVASKAEADAVMALAGKAGATIVKPAQDTFWGGYAGYFQDPDAHLWEVAWNPQWTVQIAPMIEKGFAERFAREWIAAWNSHDLDRILAHYEDDFEMSSPFIRTLAGEPSGKLRGKAAVRAYWARALRAVPDLRFELVEVLAGADSVTIYYQGHRGHVAEVVHFGPGGKVRAAFAHYAAEPQ